MLYNCSSAKRDTNSATKTEKGPPLCAMISMQNEPYPYLCHPAVLGSRMFATHLFYSKFGHHKNMKTALFSILFHGMMT